MIIEESVNSFKQISLTIESQQELEDFISILNLFRENCPPPCYPDIGNTSRLAGNILEGLQELNK